MHLGRGRWGAHFSIESWHLQTQEGASENKVDEIERRELWKERVEIPSTSNYCSAGPFFLSHERDFWFTKHLY